MIAGGDLDWSADEDGDNGVQLQVDGNDIVSITDVMTDGKAHVVVWASSHPDSAIAWEGFVNVRERQDEGDPDPVPEAAAATAADLISAYLGSQSEWTDPAGMLAAVATMLEEAGFRHPGEDVNIAYYRERADALGLEHDAE
jgi:hypothetical protein